MKKFGLIGYPLGHSFSKKYYDDKIHKENIIGIDYNLYPIETIEQFSRLLEEEVLISGINITIPYKQAIIPYLDKLSAEAAMIGAVNCVTINRENGRPYLEGFNTDVYGFEKSFLPLLDPITHKKALVLGNGGAAQAVLYVLEKLGIPSKTVSRTKSTDTLTYQDLTELHIKDHQIIINCTPLGTFPDVEKCPDIPYHAITSSHYLYDLIYNPEETLFLRQGKEKGARTKNGYEMLLLQAEKNWQIWSM